MPHPSGNDDEDGDEDSSSSSAPDATACSRKMQDRRYDQSDDDRRTLIVHSVRAVGLSEEKHQDDSHIEKLAEVLAVWLKAGNSIIGLHHVHSVHVERVRRSIEAKGISVECEADEKKNKTAILWCTPQSVLQPLPSSGPPCGLPAVPGAEAACSAPVVALLACPPFFFCRPAVAAASWALPSSLAPVCPCPTLSTHYSSSSALVPPPLPSLLVLLRPLHSAPFRCQSVFFFSPAPAFLSPPSLPLAPWLAPPSS